ncbi:four helix bundle protein [Taibaiella lutea]|uniref:Four helix bundle protein n=1 Tax=Taibaiella lutea TaxID=2608001 RepID=A0A5M6CRR6_9BACT|nr:four helix bundle protein [Taibaiella lutea]KAA5537080.1 four helix bundle protein [Taibaiella lutea]
MIYDLEERCLVFARAIRDFCKVLKHDTINLVYIKQIIRSSSSIGANYIEANESLGKQDMKMKINISRKEAKETQYWLKLLISDDEKQKQILEKEAEELKRILSAILNKLS